MYDPAQEEPPSQTERILATLGVLTDIPFPFIGPIVAYFVLRGKSRYGAAHCVSSVMGQLVFHLVLFVGLLLSVAYTIYRVMHHIQTDWEEFSLWEIVIRFAIWVVVLGILYVTNILLTVKDAIKAWQGQWPKPGRAVKHLVPKRPSQTLE